MIYRGDNVPVTKEELAARNEAAAKSADAAADGKSLETADSEISHYFAGRRHG